MSETVLLHVEGDPDIIVSVTAPDDSRVGTFCDDGPYLTFCGAKVLEVYRRKDDGSWEESVQALNELYSSAKNREEKNDRTRH